MIDVRLLGSAISIVGTLFHLAVVVDMAPSGWSARRPAPQGWHHPGFLPIPPLRLWAPHMENSDDGRAGGRCPGRQTTGAPFRIEESPLPGDYDPHAFPEADVIACVWLDARGVARQAQLVGGTGNSALDRRLLRSLNRQWRFAPANGGEAPPGWQRIRLNSGRSWPPLP